MFKSPSAKLFGQYRAAKNSKDPVSKLSKVLEEMIQKDEQPWNLQNSDGYTLVTKAISESNIKVAEYLIGEMKDLNGKDGFEKCPIHYAAEKGHTDLISKIIKNKGNINQRGMHGQVALHYAVRNKQIETVIILLGLGAIPDMRDDSSQSPKDLALEMDLKDIVSQFRKQELTKQTALVPYDEGEFYEKLRPQFQKDIKHLGNRLECVEENQEKFDTRLGKVEVQQADMERRLNIVGKQQIKFGEQIGEAGDLLKGAAKLIHNFSQDRYSPGLEAQELSKTKIEAEQDIPKSASIPCNMRIATKSSSRTCFSAGVAVSASGKVGSKHAAERNTTSEHYYDSTYVEVNDERNTTSEHYYDSTYVEVNDDSQKEEEEEEEIYDDVIDPGQRDESITSTFPEEAVPSSNPDTPLTEKEKTHMKKKMKLLTSQVRLKRISGDLFAEDLISRKQYEDLHTGRESEDLIAFQIFNDVMKGSRASFRKMMEILNNDKQPHVVSLMELQDTIKSVAPLK